jgi:hypothetical protein
VPVPFLFGRAVAATICLIQRNNFPRYSVYLSRRVVAYDHPVYVAIGVLFVLIVWASFGPLRTGWGGYSTRRSRPTRSIKPTARSMAAGGSSACHCHAAHWLPFHRIHLRAWRTAALAVHWPFTMTIPGPQPDRTCVIKLSDCRSGARVIACDVVAMAKAKPTRAMSLIILFLL